MPFYFLNDGLPQHTPQDGGYYFTEFTPPGGSHAVAPASPRKETPQDFSAHPAFDVHAIRRDFPILKEQVNGRPLAWFDNAATTQKPQSVIDRVSYFYAHENSNIHRAAHELAARATDAYEGALRARHHRRHQPDRQHLG